MTTSALIQLGQAQRDRRLRNCCWTESTHHQRGTPFSPGTLGVPPQIKRCSSLKATYSVAFSFSGTPGTPGTPFFEGYRFLTSIIPSHWASSASSSRVCHTLTRPNRLRLSSHKSFLAQPAPNVEDVTLGPNQQAIDVEHLFPLEHLVFQLK